MYIIAFDRWQLCSNVIRYRSGIGPSSIAIACIVPICTVAAVRYRPGIGPSSRIDHAVMRQWITIHCNGPVTF